MKFSLLVFILAAFGMHALNAVDLVQCYIYFLGIPTGQFFEKRENCSCAHAVAYKQFNYCTSAVVREIEDRDKK